jgi:hypothetical protein
MISLIAFVENRNVMGFVDTILETIPADPLLYELIHSKELRNDSDWEYDSMLVVVLLHGLSIVGSVGVEKAFLWTTDPSFLRIFVDMKQNYQVKAQSTNLNSYSFPTLVADDDCDGSFIQNMNQQTKFLIDYGTLNRQFKGFINFATTKGPICFKMLQFI